MKRERESRTNNKSENKKIPSNKICSLQQINWMGSCARIYSSIKTDINQRQQKINNNKNNNSHWELTCVLAGVALSLLWLCSMLMDQYWIWIERTDHREREWERERKGREKCHDNSRSTRNNWNGPNEHKVHIFLFVFFISFFLGEKRVAALPFFRYACVPLSNDTALSKCVKSRSTLCKITQTHTRTRYTFVPISMHTSLPDASVCRNNNKMKWKKKTAVAVIGYTFYWQFMCARDIDLGDLPCRCWVTMGQNCWCPHSAYDTFTTNAVDGIGHFTYYFHYINLLIAE